MRFISDGRAEGVAVNNRNLFRSVSDKLSERDCRFFSSYPVLHSNKLNKKKWEMLKGPHVTGAIPYGVGCIFYINHRVDLYLKKKNASKYSALMMCAKFSVLV